MKDEPKQLLGIILMFLFLFLIAFSSLMILSFTGCTVSFQNISTHGTATDLVDEQQAASPQVSAKVSGPL